jgi:hypothetical protein
MSFGIIHENEDRLHEAETKADPLDVELTPSFEELFSAE